MSDQSDLSVDFTGVQGADFDVLPAGRYHVAATDWDRTEVKSTGGKLAQGTPGVNVEFTIQSGERENRRLWTNYWLAPQSLGFLKSFLKASERFEDEELEGSLDVVEAMNRVIGAEFFATVRVRKDSEGVERNQINALKPFDPDKASSGSSSSMLP